MHHVILIIYLIVLHNSLERLVTIDKYRLEFTHVISIYNLHKVKVSCCGDLSFIKHFYDNITLNTITNNMLGPEMVVICNIDIGVILKLITCINYLKSNLR